MHKFLDVILDQELRWKDQVNHVVTKGMKWITQYRRLMKVSRGVSAKYLRRFYLMVAIPRMMCVADLFLVPQSGQKKGTRGMQTNVNFTSLPANTSDICCLLKASPWRLTKSR